MKHLYMTFLLTVLMSMVGAKASAQDIKVANADGVTIYYNWNNNKTELAVTSGSYSGNVVIPSSVTYDGKEYSVTSISGAAFNKCSGLTSVEIPNSVTSINHWAFSECSGLTSVEIPNSVTSIDEGAFNKCSGLTSVEISNNVTSIGDYAFYSCSSLTSVEIPNSVTSIGKCAFEDCSSLTSVRISNSVTSIGDWAFSECSGLTSVEIPNSVTSIGTGAFNWCSGLTSVKIPNSVTSIGDYAFNWCSGLTSVEIPNSVTSIGGNAFAGCSRLTSVTSLIEEPFEIDTNTFNKYTNAILYVPAGTKNKYKATEGWKNFANIVEKKVPSGIAINEKTFPDENFRKWVLAQDYGQDGVLTEAEIAGVNNLNVNNKNIATLKGIEYFTALTNLSCDGNHLTAIDVSKNTALSVLSCSANQLTALDVSKNSALTELYCSMNQLTALDVSKNTALTFLVCNANLINETEMSNLVKSLPANNGKLYVKDLNYANEQNVITTAQVAAAKAKGWKVYAWDSAGKWIEYDSDTSGIAINEETFPDENFRKWVLAQNYGKDSVLTKAEIAGVNNIDVSNKNIASLKGIEYFTALTDLSCDRNQLTALDVSKNTALTSLDCSWNQLTALDVSKNTALTWLYCYDNQLTALDVSKNTALTILYCKGNQINEMEMGNLVKSLPANNGKLYVKELNYANEQNVITTALVAAAKEKGWKVYAWDSDAGDDGKWIEYDSDTSGIAINEETFPDENFRKWVLAQNYGQDGVLTEAEIAGVNEIAVNNKNIASLKGIEYFTALTELRCFNNQLTALDVSQNTALMYLYCYGNPLTALDVSKNTALKDLACCDNQLTALDVSKNTALTSLDCSLNQLTALDVSKNTALTWLYCYDNQLTALDLSKNTALTVLGCNYNQINETEMGNLVESLPANNGEFYVKVLNDANEQNVITTAQVAAAKAKGWKVYARDCNVGENWIEYDGDTSGIDAIEKNQSAETPVYNLNGQRVNTPVNGIYIKNGRKVLVK